MLKPVSHIRDAGRRADMLKDYANKVMDYEYNLFLTVMNVSVSKHLFDEHFTVLWANDYFYELIGYSREEYEELYHSRVDEYYQDNPEAVEHMAGIIKTAYENKEPGYEFECPLRVKDGSMKWIRVTARFTDEEYQGIPVIYAIYTDITDLKDLQLKLRTALEAAQRANLAKSEFLSRMSHDIRTPINAIVGMTEIASDHLSEPARVQDCLKKITLSSQHLLGLINDVLDMSKIESGKMTINEEPIYLQEILENIVAIMQPNVRAKEQDFLIHLRNVQHEWLLGDSLRLRQILINILSNASKFTPAGGRISFDIEELISCETGYAELCFTISDTGIGMKPGFQDHIFDTFTRERDSRVDKTEGSGLGLAITKKLVDMMGGMIFVESVQGEGTTFYVSLPFQIASEQKPLVSLQDLKLLVVDDDEAARRYLVNSLNELQACTGCSAGGADAVEELVRAGEEGGRYDAVIMDWKMPEMDAIQTAKEIRRRIGREIPILIVSAYDWSEIEEEAREIGVSGFLQKPLFKSSLCYELQRCLSQSAPPPDQSAHDFSGRRFLLAEDNELNREVAVELLTVTGAAMDVACDGLECLERFKRSPEGYYDIILMDVQMPGMNGHEAARAIRALQRFDAASIPILAMTADAFSEDVDAAMAAGMNGHLSKPLNRSLMEREIGKYLM